jgi:hypothetical protein
MSRTPIFSTLRSKMEDAGFLFEKQQNVHHQNRKKGELKFIHPLLEKRLKSDGYKVRGKKYYIKPLSDKTGGEIGLVNGKSTSLNKSASFPKPNSIDTFDNAPAWVNRTDDFSLDNLLESIKNYLENDDVFPEILPAGADLYEGLKKQVTVNKYERNSIARARCIEHHGRSCMVCGFNFKQFYGDVGDDFIHVHHITPLHTINQSYRINYETDLIPVCPNCHAMLHRKKNGSVLTVNELKSILNKQKV